MGTQSTWAEETRTTISMNTMKTTFGTVLLLATVLESVLASHQYRVGDKVKVSQGRVIVCANKVLLAEGTMGKVTAISTPRALGEKAYVTVQWDRVSDPIKDPIKHESDITRTEKVLCGDGTQTVCDFSFMEVYEKALTGSAGLTHSRSSRWNPKKRGGEKRWRIRFWN